MIFRFLLQRMTKRRNALRDNDGECKSLGKRRDVPQRHHSWKACVSTRLIYVVDERTNTTGVHDQLSQFWGVLGNLTDACCSVLPHNFVNVLQQREDLREDFSLDDELGQLDRVLGDLS